MRLDRTRRNTREHRPRNSGEHTDPYGAAWTPRPDDIRQLYLTIGDRLPIPLPWVRHVPAALLPRVLVVDPTAPPGRRSRPLLGRAA